MAHLIIYGAVTPPRLIDTRRNFKRKGREWLDRWLARRQQLQRLNYRNHVTPSSFNRGDLAIALGVGQMAGDLFGSVSSRFLDWESIHSAQNNEAVLIGGSGYFFIDQEGLLPQRLVNDAAFLVSRNIPYGFYGVGVNHVNEGLEFTTSTAIAPGNAELVERLLSGAQFVSVRDRQSQLALQPYVTTEIFITGDPALFLSPTVKRGSTKSQAALPRIGINIPFHGPAANERVREDLPRYIDCFRQLQASTNAELVQLIHFDAERIVGRLMQDAGMKLTMVDGSVEALQATYATLDLHVGGMLHSCILACSVGTPCVALAYDVKHFGFFELMGISDYCVPAKPFDAATVLARCEAALTQRDSLRQHIQHRRDELRAQTEDYLRENLNKLLRSA